MSSQITCGRLILLFATLLSLIPASQAQQAANDRLREHFKNAEVIYDWVRDAQGNQLRTFITRPRNASGKVPPLFFVGWLSCDSVEYPRGETDGFGAIFWRLIETSGFATMRMDKEGVGESAGDCSKTDFLTELSGYRAAFDSLGKYPFVDLDRVFVIGLSNGGGTSPLAVQGHPVRGYIAASSWGRTWYEHMLELERVRLDADVNKTAAEVNASLKAFTDFYSLYLIHKKTPGEIVRLHPEWANLWYDEPDSQYGRAAAFYQQLQDLNLGEAWSAVNVPVLVLRGSSDSIMSHQDSVAIADIVNRKTPGRAEFVELPNADHLLSVHDKFADSVVPKMLQWINQQLQQKQ
jgi:pimeloyl-ACP methyl ester carboxylesterase